VTVLCFAVLNAAAWVVFLHYPRGSRNLLEVERVTPDEWATVSGRATVTWSFNLDVAPPAGECAPGTVTPKIAGKWKWETARVLTWTADAPLPKASNFKFTLLPDRLRTPGGMVLPKPFVSTVSTPRLEVAGVRQAEFDERDRLVLEVEFNDEVVPAEVLPRLKVLTADGKEVGAVVHGDAVGKTARFLTDVLPTGSREGAKAYVQVKIAEGLVGRSGPLGLAQAYQCNLPIGSDLIATGANAFFDGHDTAVLALRFNNEVDLSLLKGLVSVSPAVPFHLARRYDGVTLNGAFSPATRYTISIAKAPAGVKASSCPKPDTLSVFVPDVSPQYWFEHDEGYLGSAGNRTVLAHAVNEPAVKAVVYRVYDSNLVSWRNHLEGRWAESYGKPIAHKAYPLSRQKNLTQDIRISLDELLPGDAPRDGVYLIGLESTRPDSWRDDDNHEQENYRGRSAAVLTLSDIGLTAKRARGGVTVWATSLRTAAPLEHVRVRLFSNKNQFMGEAATDRDGLARIKVANIVEGEEPRVILADRVDGDATGTGTSARDLTWLDLSGSKLSFSDADTAGAAYLRSGFEAFIYSDRGVYRPGETVHLRAIVRGADGEMPSSFPVNWKFRRPDLHDWRSFTGKVDSDGAVSLEVILPDDLPTGRWSVAIGLPGSAAVKAFGNASFQVEDFMPARMQVGVMLDGNRAGGSQRLTMNDAAGAMANVQADYLFGKPVADRPVHIVARLDPQTFSPAKWEGWTFGDAAHTSAVLEGTSVTGHRMEAPEQSLDEHGSASVPLELGELLAGDSDGKSEADDESVRPKRGRRGAAISQAKGEAKSAGPWRLTVTASVIESGGRAVSNSTQADVDVVPAYIGIHSRGTDARTTFDVAMVAPDGSVFSTPSELKATLFHEDWNNSLAYEKGRYVYHSTRVLEPVGKDLGVSLSEGKGTAEVQAPASGSYVLRVLDEKSGAVTSLEFFAGDGAWQDSFSWENPERLELVVQKGTSGGDVMNAVKEGNWRGAVTALAKAMTPKPGTIHVGETARVIVRSPFAGRLFLTVETDDVVTSHIVEMPASNMAVPVEITGLCRPNAYVTATVVRAVDPNAKWQTHRAFGTIRLPVDNSDRKLSVAVDSPAEIRPETSMGAVVRVTDSTGAPVANAAVTLAAVDEGICALTGFKTPDPFAYFARNRALGVEMADLFGQLMPEVAKPDKSSAPGGDKGAYDPRHASPVSAKRVKPVTLMSTVVHTAADGVARFDFNVPQFTGKLRLMAVASLPNSFGSGTGATLVRSPLLVQSSWPRFAAPGDKFLVPLTVFNNAASNGSASIVMHVSQGGLRFGKQRDVDLPAFTIKAGGQVTRYVEVTAGQECGVTRVTFAAKMGDETFAEDVEIPVRPARPEITRGGFLVASPSKVTEVSLPGGMLEGTRRARIQVTPAPTLQLPQGLEYLERYPYGCLEQTTSALFPLVYLSDIGQQISPGVFEKDRVAMKVNAGITRLIGMQTASGGLGMWPAYREPWPWGSVYAAHFLVEAGKAGFAVPAEFKRQLLAYVRNTLSQSTDNPETVSVQAYACYVLALAGSPERPVMSRLAEVIKTGGDGLREGEGPAEPRMSEAKFHLAAAWLASGRRDLAEGLIPQELPEPRSLRLHAGSLASPVRERAVLINTLLAVQPDNPALPAMAQKLADGGAQHEWRSTQDTAFAVIALGRYLRQARSAKPYDSIHLVRDGQALTTAESSGSIDWNVDAKDATSKFTVEVNGPGDSKAYVTWLETGVPLTPPPAADHGLTVRRRLLDERGKPLSDATRVRSGDLIQVELSISSDMALENLVVEDLLPAGLEIENPHLNTSDVDVNAPAEKDANAFRDERVDMRDDRLVVMGRLNRAGKGTYVYAVRAVTPGDYVMPGARGECMYDIGTSSISQGGRLVVTPAENSPLAQIESGN
jgi:uncharacterized protein YfaS (alpha-2-macroglobulin family)